MNYFGEEFESPCNFCDSCEAGRKTLALETVPVTEKPVTVYSIPDFTGAQEDGE